MSQILEKPNTTTGSLRQAVASQLLALARKEGSAEDLWATARALDAISYSMSVEIKARINNTGGEPEKILHLGSLRVGEHI